MQQKNIIVFLWWFFFKCIIWFHDWKIRSFWNDKISNPLSKTALIAVKNFNNLNSRMDFGFGTKCILMVFRFENAF